jgi:hypothetical protein
VTGTRILFAVVALAGLVTPVAAGWDGTSLFPRKRPDQSRVRYLVELLRSEPDAKKQKAAVNELADADPRVFPEVIPSLIAALKKDAAAVRASAAEVIGKFKTTFPLAGAALESAAETDPDASVRAAAKQALWDYHLNGYRSAKSVGGIVQTMEPPLASPVSPRSPLALAPMPSVVVTTVAKLPSPRLPEITSIPVTPGLAPEPGPRVHLVAEWNTPRQLLSLPAKASFTTEPPLAKRPVKPTPPPVVPAVPALAIPAPAIAAAPRMEPPIFIHRPASATFGPPSKVIFELPPIVVNPEPFPGAGPLPAPTTEPPVRRISRK